MLSTFLTTVVAFAPPAGNPAFRSYHAAPAWPRMALNPLEAVASPLQFSQGAASAAVMLSLARSIAAMIIPQRWTREARCAPPPAT